MAHHVSSGKPHTLQDDYELGRVLGSGTMAVVKLATKRVGGDVVAVKCILSPDEELREFTREEYQLMRELKHKTIVRVMEMYETSKDMHICMELCRDGCVQS